ncbi:hypothetical protein EVAR_89157_1 [Eumeta japonica]|uniref:Uncharacterized protein n=1 Tax=Eumeta variegata TaxID=151549 RepID=A0A4C1Z1X8_EUMVA|nr:hypothetical protein EVAR_89157_1 [Eumeta japonica]
MPIFGPRRLARQLRHLLLTAGRVNGDAPVRTFKTYDRISGNTYEAKQVSGNVWGASRVDQCKGLSMRLAAIDNRLRSRTLRTRTPMYINSGPIVRLVIKLFCIKAVTMKKNKSHQFAYFYIGQAALSIDKINSTRETRLNCCRNGARPSGLKYARAWYFGPFRFDARIADWGFDEEETLFSKTAERLVLYPGFSIFYSMRSEAGMNFV